MSTSSPSRSKRKRTLERVRWFVDHDAAARHEPGLTHSFVGCLATALDCAGYVVDPVRLMGVTGFAFRIWASGRLSPAAMNAFDWRVLLPQAVRRAGFGCTYIHGDTNGMDPNDERLGQAHTNIRRSIDRGIPAIAWDVNDPPMWGLIYGYNDFTQQYATLASWNYRIPLSYRNLGRRDVNVLSVLILEGEQEQSPQDAQAPTNLTRLSLETALLHSDGCEMPRGARARSGLAAFDRWADLMEPDALPPHALQFADYYAEMYYAFRCYAREYLARIAGRDPWLNEAAHAYGSVADALRHVHAAFAEHPKPLAALTREPSAYIRRARTYEQNALLAIRAYLKQARDVQIA
jgi:hypothetical protein